MGEVIEELPKTIVRRVVKEKLSECSDHVDLSIHKDALLAFSEAGRVFIHYLSATANELCKESKRQMMNADDVMKAIEEFEFHEFLGPLRASLEDYRRKNSKKRAGVAKVKEVSKKRKDNAPQENGTHAEDRVEEASNDNDNASDQEQQNITYDEGCQDNDEDADIDGGEDADDQEQQNVAIEEENSFENAVDIDDDQNDEDGDCNNTRSHELDADKGDTSNPAEEE